VKEVLWEEEFLGWLTKGAARPNRYVGGHRTLLYFTFPEDPLSLAERPVLYGSTSQTTPFEKENGWGGMTTVFKHRNKSCREKVVTVPHFY